MASRSSPFVSSLSERLPLDIIVILGAVSAFTLAESVMPRLTIILTPSVRTEGADERLVPAVSDRMPDLERLAAMWLHAVMWLEAREAGFAFPGISAAQSTTSLCFRFLDESLSVQ